MAASFVKWALPLFLLGWPAKRLTVNHPFYVTVTEIDYNPKDKALEISCKIFTNDFESALEKVFNGKVDLHDSRDKGKNDKLITQYIVKHLQLRVDGRSPQLHYVGTENRREATWSYFEIDDVAALKHLEVSNTILYESFESEINIMHVTVSGVRKSLEITNPASAASFDFLPGQ